MRFKILSTISLVLAAATAGCSDDELMYPGQVDDEATGRSPLRFEVNPFSVGTGGSSRSSEPSAIPEPESEEERQIRDFWLFQFKTDGSKIASKYYSIPTDGATLDDLTNKAYTDLAQNTRMTIFVVTNTGDAAWGNGFNSLTEVKNAALPSPFPIQAGLDSDNDGKPDGIYIPMSGQVDNVTATGLIEVPVTRTYAKIKIQAGFPDNTMNLYYANVEGIPWYCKVTSLSGEPDADVPAAVPFPEGTRMISRAFNSKQMIIDADNKKWLVLYMPENIRGEVSGIDKNKTPRDSDIPKDALTVTIRAKYDGADYYYKVYPGENTTNNFNIRRNRVYRVTIDVRQIQEQHNPSSNCYVVKPGEKLQFEPYNRDEKGGDYDISTYLDPDVTSKRIAKVGIIWQTKDCIGDNSKGDLVCFEANEQDPKSSKVIIKKTGAEGNALVGAYNSSGKII